MGKDMPRNRPSGCGEGHTTRSRHQTARLGVTPATHTHKRRRLQTRFSLLSAATTAATWSSETFRRCACNPRSTANTYRLGDDRPHTSNGGREPATLQQHLRRVARVRHHRYCDTRNATCEARNARSTAHPRSATNRAQAVCGDANRVKKRCDGGLHHPAHTPATNSLSPTVLSHATASCRLAFHALYSRSLVLSSSMAGSWHPGTH